MYVRRTPSPRRRQKWSCSHRVTHTISVGPLEWGCNLRQQPVTGASSGADRGGTSSAAASTGICMQLRGEATPVCPPLIKDKDECPLLAPTHRYDEDELPCSPDCAHHSLRQERSCSPERRPHARAAHRAAARGSNRAGITRQQPGTRGARIYH
jgi:hypothetical protein